MHNGINFFEIIYQSGLVVKLVLIFLIISSVVSWAIIFKKFSFFKTMELRNELFLKNFSNAQSLSEVYRDMRDFEDCPFREMFVEGYQEMLRLDPDDSSREIKVREHLSNCGIDWIERSLKKGVNTSTIRLEGWLSTLASIGSVTPFIGLFGTVWGIIDSFKGLASGGGTIEAVAPGIAEALIATAVGLFAAIPAVWFYNSFSNRVSEFSTKMENFGQDFINLIERTFSK